MKIPFNERVETGVIQFGDDWPGYFFRGDAALNESGEMRYIAEHIDELSNEVISKKLLSLSKMFKECQK